MMAEKQQAPPPQTSMQTTPKAGQVTKIAPNVGTFRDLLEKNKAQLQLGAARHLDVGKMVRVALTSMQKTPELLECAPITVIGAVMQAGQLGLYPDGISGEAHLVPFFNSKKQRLECQLIPGYKGIRKLALRSGKIVAFYAQAVHEGDYFEYELGTNPNLVHKLALTNRGKVIAFYAIASYSDGLTKHVEVMTLDEVEAIRGRSKAAKGFSPWSTDFEEMGKKTVLKRAGKNLPSESELQTALGLDDRAEIGLPQDLGILADQDSVGTRERETETIATNQEPIKRAKALQAPAAEPAEAVVDDAENKAIDKELSAKEGTLPGLGGKA